MSRRKPPFTTFARVFIFQARTIVRYRKTEHVNKNKCDVQEGSLGIPRPRFVLSLISRSLLIRWKRHEGRIGGARVRGVGMSEGMLHAAFPRITVSGKSTRKRFVLTFGHFLGVLSSVRMHRREGAGMGVESNRSGRKTFHACELIFLGYLFVTSKL